jgi:hypothetical protein
MDGGGLGHYSRVNDDPDLPWYGPTVFASNFNVDAVTLIQSNFTAGPSVGNLEVVALSQGGLLYFWREDVPPYVWHGPVPMKDFQPALQFVGNPVLIQSRFGNRGNFELVVPIASGGIAHYSRANDMDGVPWFGPNLFAVELGRVDAVAMVQSNLTTGGFRGDLEVVARVGGNLYHYFREDQPPYRWFGPFLIHIPENGLAMGVPVLIQSRSFPGATLSWLNLITPQSNGLAYYSRSSDPFDRVWRSDEIVEFGPIEGTSAIRSNFSSANTDSGNAEVVVRYGTQLLHFWRDDVSDISSNSYYWFGPWIVTSG